MRKGIVGGCVVASLMLGVGSASAAITVNTTKDETIAGDGTCSLREAVQAASGSPSPDCPGRTSSGVTTISLPAGHYRLSLGSELALTGDMAIVGSKSDPSQTVIDAALHSRVLLNEGTASLSRLTITGGRAAGPGPAGAPGGGIENDGTLALSNVMVAENASGNGGGGAVGDSGSTCTAGGDGADGGNGGGIFNHGILTMSRVTVSGNQTGDGGTGGSGGDRTGPNRTGCAGGGGGSGGSGAGVFSDGQLTVNQSTITGNATGNGGAGGAGGRSSTGGAAGSGGAGGDGAGIASAIQSGAATVTASAIATNLAGNGGTGGAGGPGADPGTGATGGDGGRGGRGAGVFSDAAVAGTMSLTNSTIAQDVAGDGGYGGSAGAGHGSGHSGGAGGDGADGADGGGVYADTGSVALSADTLAGDLAGDGGGPGTGGSGQDSAATGPQGIGGGAGSGGAIAVGPAVMTSVPSISEQDTLVAASLPENCSGTIADGGENLSFPESSCPGEVAGDPRLGALQNNGGAAPTMALKPGSAAINQVPASGAGCPAVDQRNVVRPQPANGRCDVGAYEVAPPVCRSLADATAMGQPIRVSLACADPSGLAVKYAIKRRPAHGSLGTLDASGGKVTYTPRAGFVGRDSFTYQASNSNGTATVQTVTLTVTRVPPKLTAAKLARTQFTATAGTQLHFTLSAAAALTITITHKNGKAAGTLTFAREPAGKDTVAFKGEVGNRALAAGAYRATLVASNAGGRSAATVLTFTILKPPASINR